MKSVSGYNLYCLTALFALLFTSGSCNSQKIKPMKETDKAKYTNELIHETSPYLLQHAHNPVNWMPWGEAAFEAAKKEDKLILVSVGYSACHWCHVMEHESFEDESVAKLMNDLFICIKVDREERPDVDQVYMNAVQLMTGSGGWPLNCFTLPDGRPVYGGTYFPKDQWVQVLQNLEYTYRKDKARMLEYADNLTQGVQQTELIEVKTENLVFEREKLDEMMVNWRRSFDHQKGGNNRAPKFPMPNNYEFMLQYAWHAGDTGVLNHVYLTLDQMAMGGIYDQVGGGFSRYSVDSLWKVPHFEKMLYDNAQLVSLYSHAYQLMKKELYKTIVYQTLAWVHREMTTPDGAFYAALDADSEGVEGKFYVWTEQELTQVLGDDLEFAKVWYNISSYGLWEENYILTCSRSSEEIADSMKITVDEVNKRVKSINEKLFNARSKRVRPGLDDKALTSWNALMLSAYVDAYQTFGENLFLDAALLNAHWLVKNQLKKDGALWRTYKNGKGKIAGFLEDYALVAEAFLKVYEATFDEKWIEKATLVTEYACDHFYDTLSGMFFYTSNLSMDLVARKMDLSDNVIPASNSVMARVLFRLGTLTDNAEYKAMASQMLANVYDGMESYGSAYSNWGILAMNFTYPFYEVAVTGSDWRTKVSELNTYYLPNKILLGGETGKLDLLAGKFSEETRIFVCANKVCRSPENEVKSAVRQIARE